MSRRGWILFILCGFLWGIPYLFIRIAVRDFSPAAIVFARVVIGAAILIPLSVRSGALKTALRGYKYIALYSLTEIVGPWFLITRAETKISSGLTGLLVATVPIWSTIFASLNGDKTVWHHKRLIGMVVGFIGVIALVGIESISGESDLMSILAVLLASVGYGYAVNMISKKLPGVSGIAINAVAMAMAAILYAPFAFSQWPQGPVSSSALVSLLALGIFPTAIAFIVFFAIMEEIGAARGSLVTYLNTAFAVLLGVLILSEPLTLGMAIGLPMVLFGSYLASRKPTESKAN